MKKLIIVFAFFVFVLILSSLTTLEGITVSVNTLSEINQFNNKVKLIPLREWGGDDEEDENKFFRDPTDIILSKDGTVFICDSGNHRIQVFNSSGRYLRTIGRRGNGPLDFLNPKALAFNTRNELGIADCFNNRIQIIGMDGKYIGGFKFLGEMPSNLYFTQNDEVIIFDRGKAFLSKELLMVFDKNGKKTRTIGEYIGNTTKLENFESIFFYVQQNNIWISYYATPVIFNYSSEGNLLSTITYEVPFQTSYTHFSESKKKIEISGERKEQVCAGLSTDNQGRIFLISVLRKKTPIEKQNSILTGAFKPGSGMIRKINPVENINTDRFRLLVFNSHGKIIAAKQLNVFCDKIYIYENRLFIIDTFKGMKIYEYTVSF